MKNNVIKIILMFVLVLTLGSRCKPEPTPTTTTCTSAVLKLEIYGTGITAYGIDMTVSLPNSVKLKSNANPPETDAGVVSASGATAANSNILATYTAATTSTLAGNARVLIVNSNGIGAGEFASVTGDTKDGNCPKTTDFSLVNFSMVDMNGEVISGLTPTFTVDVK